MSTQERLPPICPDFALYIVSKIDLLIFTDSFFKKETFFLTSMIVEI